MVDRWDQIRELFDRLSSLPPSSRAARLGELCGDPEIQAEVLSLLAHDERASPAFLAPLPPPAHPMGLQALPLGPGGHEGDVDHDPLIGMRLGKYLIHRVIAHGGMGAVYQAEQEHPRRTVALKVVHAWVWSQTARRRFEFEIQTLARLTHPNIAQVFDAGFAQPEPADNDPSLDPNRAALREEAAYNPSRGQGSVPREVSSGPASNASPPPPSPDPIRDLLPSRASLPIRDHKVEDPPRQGVVSTSAVIPPPYQGGGQGEVAFSGREREHADLSPAPLGSGASPHARQTAPVALPPLHFFVMELVPGASTLTDYAESRHLNVHQRVELILQACDAVHYGHQRGIIHRDLKPANILVDQSGRVKIIDFGVAKATDSDIAAATVATDAGQLIGTLTYMSPEQCTPDPLGLDVRADVYSLGVVLYQLLCDRLPYHVPRNSLTHAARAICEEPPTRPATIDRSLRGNLEAILLKALEKDRARRYQSVADLARDLRRHLNREPVEARPPTMWSRSAYWVARHPLYTTAAAASFIATTVLVTAWLVFRYSFVDPHEIKLHPQGSSVQLLTAGGHVLHTWDGPFACFTSAKLITPQLAVIGFRGTSEQPGSRRFCAFDVGDAQYEFPIWCSTIEEHDLPEFEDYQRLGFAAGDFWPETVFDPVDLFPESEGPEIPATFAHSQSRRALRIYSVNGDVLFQGWHDGGIFSLEYLPKPRLLILSAEDASQPWVNFGLSNALRHNPITLVGVRPLPGHRGRAFWNTSTGTMDKALSWYKVLCPANLAGTLSMARVRAHEHVGYADGSHSSVDLDFCLPGAPKLCFGASMTIDAAGSILPGGYLKTDEYLRPTATLNDGIESIFLVDRLDIKSKCLD